MSAEKIIILCPTLRQRVDTQNATEVFVEAHPAVSAVITLPIPGPATFKAAIDDIGDPAQTILPVGCLVCRAGRFRPKEDLMATWLAYLASLWEARPASEPEPDR